MAQIIAAVRGHMPFEGHRTVSEWWEGVPARPAVARARFVAVPPRNKTLPKDAEIIAARARLPERIGPPPYGEWILGFWPHMVNTGGSLSRFGGWFPSRFHKGAWQAQFGSYFARHIAGAPTKWKILPEESHIPPGVGGAASELAQGAAPVVQGRGG